jgi:putative MFS transporter
LTGILQLGGLAERRGLWAFVVGCLAVTVGVVLHLPMFLMARNMGYRLAGTPMDGGMLRGMALIVVGIGLAAYGVLPRKSALRASHPEVIVTPPEDAPLTGAHLRLMVVLVVALIIDVMKPASLGFVVPGMMNEYHVPKSVVAWLPFSALLGTFVGSIVWGVIADLYGRKAAILLAAITFVGTSICGAMPSLGWNVVMCFLMGAAAGGMLPVTFALLAEVMPSRHRGWCLVLVGGLGSVGGYLLASGLSAVLQPTFGWRIMWFLNLPTGLILILLGSFIPESAKFLTLRGRLHEAQATLRRYGSVVVEASARASAEFIAPGAHLPPIGRGQVGATAALTVTGIAWGLINFGLLLWLPTEMVAKGYSMALSSKLLAQSALIALPTVFVATFLYSRWSTKWSLAAAMGVTALGLIGVLQLETRAGVLTSPVLPVALLIIGSNAIIAVLLPYAAESFALRVRGRATGWVAGCTKMGGLIAQALSIAALVPPLTIAAGAILAPVGLSLVMTAVFGAETRGRDLRELDRAAIGAASNSRPGRLAQEIEPG